MRRNNARHQETWEIKITFTDNTKTTDYCHSGKQAKISKGRYEKRPNVKKVTVRKIT